MKLEEFLFFLAHYFNQSECPSCIFSCSKYINLYCNNKDIFIGTTLGRCMHFSLETMAKMASLYEDTQKRQIVAIGLWPNRQKSKMINIDETDSSIEPIPTILWLHFRSSAITLFRLVHSNNKLSLTPLRELATNHYGFCKAMTDLVQERIFIPDYENLRNVLRVHYPNGGEAMFYLDEEFMTQSFSKNKAGIKVESPEDKGMFKGILMGIGCCLDKANQQILLAFEDSTICVFNLQTKEVMDALKHPKYQEFLTWSVVNINGGPTLIAVSVVGQLYLLTHFDDGINAETLKAQCVIRKCKGDNDCTALTISPVSEADGIFRMAIGLKNGVILIYKLYPSLNCNSDCQTHSQWSSNFSSQQQEIQSEPLLQCTTSHHKFIQCIYWSVALNDDEFPETSLASMSLADNNPSTNANATTTFPSFVLCCGSSDEKITFYDFTSSAAFGT